MNDRDPKVAAIIEARVNDLSEWYWRQVRRMEEAWDNLPRFRQREIKEVFLSFGDRAPEELQCDCIELCLGITLDPPPKPSDDFLWAVAELNAPTDPMAYKLGDNSYSSLVFSVMRNR